MRTLTHPGAPLFPRHLLEWSAEGGLFHLTVPGGSDLLESLHAALRSRGVLSAGIVLLGGTVERLQFMTGRPLKDGTEDAGEDGGRVATWHGPHEIACPATVIGGGASYGPGEEGQPVTHCHALFADAAGAVRGGHLMPGHCIAGPGGIRVWATELRGAGFRVSQDEETDFPIFHPGALP